ncbi:MAG: EamA family transporter [Anaerolineales bacterium]|jgi:drug/metabolite transporter (DMT)-like permease|nr:EamA family transporter [Anaerolineales bacterium]MBK9778586.1 EamA family transporter [Anaerolineales bacterium]
MKRFTGILLIGISAASFGTLAIFGRFAYADGMDTFTVLFLRFGLSAAFMTFLLILRKEPYPRGRILAQLIGMGAIGYVGQSFLYMTAIKYASAGLVALLLYLYPFFVAVLSVIFLHEKLTRTKIIALVLALVGAALTVGPVSGQLIGAVMAIVAALIYSIYIIIGTNVMKHVSPVQSSAVIFASAGAVYGMLTFVNGAHFPTGEAGWLAVLGIIFISTIIPVNTFLAGLDRIGPTNAAMLSTIEPIVTVLLSTWLFGDQLLPIVLVGGGLILTAVVLLTRSELQTKEI